MTKLFFIRRRGFTLIELLIVIAILAILAAAVMIAINPAKRIQQARDATRLADTSQISESIAEYVVTYGTYPPDPAISQETEFASDEGPNWIPGLDNLPQDPNQAGIRQFLARILPQTKIIKNTGEVAAQQTINVSPTNDAVIRLTSGPARYPPDSFSDSGCFTDSTWDYLSVGEGYYNTNPYPYLTERSYLEFDTAVIPDDASIISVSLKLTVQTDSNGSYNVKFRSFNWGGATSCSPMGTLPRSPQWGGNPPIATEVGSLSINAPLNFGQQVNANLNPSLIDKTGKSYMMMSTDKEEANQATMNGFNLAHFYSVNAMNAPYRPVLSIVYTTTPPPVCSPRSQTVAKGTPTTVTATGGNGLIQWVALGQGWVQGGSGGTGPGTPFVGSGPSFTTTYNITGNKTVRASSDGLYDYCDVVVVDALPSPSPSPSPSIATSPSPSPPPKGCKNKKKIYCYLVPLDRKTAVLWAVLEDENDERLYYKPTAKCKNTPPADTFLNYCINNP